MKSLGIVGATGLVGQTVLKILEEKNLDIFKYVFLASKKSKDKIIKFKNKNYKVKELNKNSFKNLDYAIFVVNSDISKEYAPIAVKNNCIVIDNSSAFRMNPAIPLIVPEVNPNDLNKHNGIISNPNCSTIQSVVPLKILDKNYSIKRIIYSTYQAVSGAGKKGLEDLKNTENGLPPTKFPYPIYNNCLPEIGDFLENGYTTEEEKMINETRKILHLKNLPITATTVRVPIQNSHSININVELKKNFILKDVISNFKNSKGIIFNNLYDIPTNVTGHDEVFVGRVRKDYSIKYGLNLWIVADNLRKGAATNAIQILELLLKKEKEKND